MVKIKKPKNGQYNCYCFECTHWEFTKQIGAFYDGRCYLIKDEPSNREAYSPPCPSWERRK